MTILEKYLLLHYLNRKEMMGEKIKLKNEKYRMFTRDTPPEEAKEEFMELFGHEPEICEVIDRHLFVGPIKEKNAHD